MCQVRVGRQCEGHFSLEALPCGGRVEGSRSDQAIVIGGGRAVMSGSDPLDFVA